MKAENKYLIRFNDGSYNWHLGHPVRRDEASRYDTLEAAQTMAENLMGVEEIECETQNEAQGIETAQKKV